MLDAAARALAEGARAIDVTANRRAEGFYAKFGFLPLRETHTRFGQIAHEIRVPERAERGQSRLAGQRYYVRAFQSSGPADPPTWPVLGADRLPTRRTAHGVRTSVFVVPYSSGDRIRHARTQELAGLPGVQYAADEIFRAAGIGPLPASAYIDALRKSLFVLVAGDPPIAFARAIEVDGQAHLEQMSVIPERMRAGTGARLLEQCIHTARESGYERLTLITFANIAWNAPFYVRHGFRPLLQLTPGLQRLREREKVLKLDAIGARVVLAIDLTKVCD